MEAQERDEIKRVVREVVAEEVKAVILPFREEVQVAFDRQAELIQQEFRQINQRLTALETRVAKLEEIFGALNERVNKRLEKTSDDISELTITTKRHRADQITLQERIEELEARVAQLEAARHG